MEAASRESQITKAFVALADTLTTDFDVVDLLHMLVVQCTEILDSDSGGLMLVDGAGHLQLMTSTNEDADLVEVMQLAADSGPCIECFTSGVAVTLSDIETAKDLWPSFYDGAKKGGFRSAHATPLKLRGQVIGTMNLFSRTPGGLDAEDVSLAQALADVATISILQERIAQESYIVQEQLQRALDSRIVIEQAKGVISYSHKLSMDESFRALRSYARNNNIGLRSVAEGVTTGTLTADTVITSA